MTFGGGSVAQTAGGGGQDEDPDDARLFREAVRDVKPLPAPAPADARPKPRPRARFTRADRAAVLRESLAGAGPEPPYGGEELTFHRPGVQPSVLRKLRRGEYRVQREIDLHGLTVAQAKQALRQFLIDALEAQVRCVRIIHGKGLRSGARGPVLKGAVGSVLQRSAAVLACVSARPADGGTGALYALLAGP
jgi:DNA-nicking Smr family endonuclease